MTEKNWECNSCGRQLQSEIEPDKCPCGNENIEAKEQLSLLEQMMQDFLDNDDKKKAKS